MPTSTIPAVKAALLTLIQAALPTVQVTWADPRGDKEREWIRIGDVTGDQSSAALGRQRRGEAYRIEILVSIVRPDIETAQSIAERAYELAGDIEDAVRPPGPAGSPVVALVPGLLWANVEKTDLREGQAGGERWAEVSVLIGCESRI